MVQGDIDDGCVNNLDERRQHDCNCYQPFVDLFSVFSHRTNSLASVFSEIACPDDRDSSLCKNGGHYGHAYAEKFTGFFQIIEDYLDGYPLHNLHVIPAGVFRREH